MKILAKLTDEHTKTFTAIKSKRPKMTMHAGRTWDYIGKLAQEPFSDLYTDTTWGFYAYFEIDNQWYKFRMIDKWEAFKK